jgi:CYTH domain-containing protein
MSTEIERKYVVAGDGWGPADDGIRQRQGYLAITDRGTVRVRVAGGRARLNVKGAQKGLTRAEYEYEIPLADAEEMLDTLCGLVVEKTRYEREFGGRVWEVDVFHGENDGLVTAEVELASEEEEVLVPDWATEDVSRDERYRVACLARHPYRAWRDRDSASKA